MRTGTRQKNKTAIRAARVSRNTIWCSLGIRKGLENAQSNHVVNIFIQRIVDQELRGTPVTPPKYCACPARAVAVEKG